MGIYQVDLPMGRTNFEKRQGCSFNISEGIDLVIRGTKARKGETPTGSYAEHSCSTDSDPTGHLREELLELGDAVDQRTSPLS